MEDIQLPNEINAALLRALSESKDAGLLLAGFFAGKELYGKKVILNARFYVSVEETNQE